MKEYLGDAVYATWDEDTQTLILTTEHHDPEMANNVIFLEPEVMHELSAFLNQINLG